MQTRILAVPLLLTILVGCGDQAQPPQTSGPPQRGQSVAPQAEVLIERVGEQVVGIKATRDDVQVLNEIPPATIEEYRRRYGAGPKRFLFSAVDLQFYTYGHNGARIALKTREPRR